MRLRSERRVALLRRPRGASKYEANPTLQCRNFVFEFQTLFIHFQIQSFDWLTGIKMCFLYSDRSDTKDYR